MKRALLVVAALNILVSSAFAGGPIQVGGPFAGVEGVPYKWNPASFPIKYRVDGGPLSSTVDHATGVARVDAMFGTWASVPTASLQFQNAGSLLPATNFSDGDVSTVAEIDGVLTSCDNGVQSPVIFDANGALFAVIPDGASIIGISSVCLTTGSTINTAFVVLNGTYLDGIDTTTNHELTAAEFDETITHEIGHLLGLDHSQINLNVLSSSNCLTDDLAGLPLMFPFAACQAKSTVGLPMLSPDDVAWISYFYPSASFATSYGFVEGEVRFSDGVTPAQGVNIIARRVDDPSTPENESKRIAVSVVSGFLFTDWPGQNTPGLVPQNDPFGSRQANHEGYFKIPLPPGDWVISVESVSDFFTDGSGVGPLRHPPVPMPGTAPAPASVTITAGQTTALNIVLVGTPKRFDVFEDESRLIVPPLFAYKEEEPRA